ncbi:MAG: HAD family phosphatase [Planctomycetaceae bacterium]|nr:HAD family phosphatase [Planctomycetaceae bacterium]
MDYKEFGVIFDIDGTMVNNTPYHRQAWFDLCRRYNIPMDHDSYHQKIHAHSNDYIVPALFGPDVDHAFIRRIENEKESLYRQTFKPFMKPTPGLIDLLEKLRQASIPCAAASNSPKENVDFVLDELNVRHLFTAITFRDLVSVGKPHPELFLKAAEGLALAPHRCLVFEDSASGFQAARAAGMSYVAITFCADPHELTEAHDAAAVRRDFIDLTPAALSAYIKD